MSEPTREQIDALAVEIQPPSHVHTENCPTWARHEPLSECDCRVGKATRRIAHNVLAAGYAPSERLREVEAEAGALRAERRGLTDQLEAALARLADYENRQATAGRQGDTA